MQREKFFQHLTVERLEQMCFSLESTAGERFVALKRAFAIQNNGEAETIFRQLVIDHELFHRIEHVKELVRGTQPLEPTFLVSTELLYTSSEQLSKHETEVILYATGTAFDNLFTIERLVDVELERSEYGRATTSIAASTRIMAELDKRGSLLTAYLHMHPGRGKSANHPSQIDLTNQMQLETAGYRTIGIIFSRDGYIRFFSYQMPFRIYITGKGVRHVGEHNYQLIET